MLDFLKRKIVEIVVGFVVTLLLGSGVQTLASVRDEIQKFGVLMAVHVEKVRVLEKDREQDRAAQVMLFDKLHYLDIELTKLREPRSKQR